MIQDKSVFENSWTGTSSTSNSNLCLCIFGKFWTQVELPNNARTIPNRSEKSFEKAEVILNLGCTSFDSFFDIIE